MFSDRQQHSPFNFERCVTNGVATLELILNYQ